MIESFVCRKPSSEELAAEYRGLSFAEFAQLDDDQLEKLNEERRQESDSRAENRIAELRGGDCSPMHREDDFWRRVDETAVFLRFAEWRRNGIPDRNMTREELLQRTADVIRARKAADPEFGELQPEHYANLPKREQIVVDGLLQYLHRKREPYEPFVIDGAVLTENRWMRPQDFSAVVRRGVLEPVTEPRNRGVKWLLAEPYTNWLLAESFTGQPAAQ